ncbi:hypothetical protein JD844_023626 [Phrynosoma platyrhinos]|uniref:Nucleophosmin n=1 Tax=Phrynosoma platyrhinos TaxID=52577 RepID=A0ABQ7SWX5_PHRPL|nr:hypothetical protein JD844_023626 [Phrynosoma platyrhinos]
MEDSDMDNMGSLRPQTFLFGCELKGDKPFHFKVNDEENEHQLSLRTVSLGAGAKDELHVVEAEALDYEGNQITVTLASLKMSVQPTFIKCAALEEEPVSEDEEDDKPARDSSVKKTPKSNQNGKDSKLATPKLKTPEAHKEKKPQTPKSPKSFTLDEIKAKMQAAVQKGTTLPKAEAKFVNYVKNCYRTEDHKVIQALWQWRQTL